MPDAALRHRSGKSKGQFYTPAELSRVIAQVVSIGPDTRQDQTIYDPTSGSGRPRPLQPAAHRHVGTWTPPSAATPTAKITDSRSPRSWASGAQPQAPILRDLHHDAVTARVIDALSESSLDCFRDLPLISAYDVYQRLMDYWDNVMQDDVHLRPQWTGQNRPFRDDLDPCEQLTEWTATVAACPRAPPADTASVPHLAAKTGERHKEATLRVRLAAPSSKNRPILSSPTGQNNWR